MNKSKIYEFQFDYLDTGQMFTIDIMNTNEERESVQQYLQNISKDVRFIKEYDKPTKKQKGTRHIPCGIIIDAKWRRDKCSTFGKTNTKTSDARYTLTENEEDSYEILNDTEWESIKGFHMIKSGDIIRVNGENILKLLTDPYLVSDVYRVTVAEERGMNNN